MPKNLQQQIENKLTVLEKAVAKIRHKVIEPDNPEMGDSAYYYDLASKLKAALQLLEGEKQTDRYGEEIVCEAGLCSLLDDGETKKEAND